MTDTKTVTRDTSTEKPQDKPAETKRLFDMSASQLAGGALAAMTSAVIGAQLGVAGTVVGAAVGSLVAGVAGSLYTVSIKRTKDKISSAIVGKAGDTTVSVAPVSEDTVVWEDWDTTSRPTAAEALPSPAPVAADTLVGRSGRQKSRLPWKPILVSTFAVFLLAIAGITGFELVSGQAISGGQGTTITQVSDGGSGSTDDEPAETSSSTSSDDTSTEPSTESSASSEASATASSEASTEPSSSTEATESAEPSTSSEPTTSATATPSTASDEQSAADTTDEDTVTGG